MRKTVVILLAGLFVVGSASITATAAETLPIRFGGNWALSGLFKSFGMNSKAVYQAFVDELHEKGGVRLSRGRIGKIETNFYDSA